MKLFKIHQLKTLLFGQYKQIANTNKYQKNNKTKQKAITNSYQKVGCSTFCVYLLTNNNICLLTK